VEALSLETMARDGIFQFSSVDFFHYYEIIAANTLTEDTVQDFEMVQGHFLFMTLFQLVVKLKISATS
jgi:hypothetical protein